MAAAPSTWPSRAWRSRWRRFRLPGTPVPRAWEPSSTATWLGAVASVLPWPVAWLRKKEFETQSKVENKETTQSKTLKSTFANGKLSTFSRRELIESMSSQENSHASFLYNCGATSLQHLVRAPEPYSRSSGFIAFSSLS